MTATPNRTARPAMTLVEMLVAMALALGIMWILAESFKMGMDLTRYAHATGELTSQLNGAGAVITRDLQADHFLPDDNAPNRGVRLSDQRLDKLGINGSQWKPPRSGYFRIVSPTTTPAGYDPEGFAVNFATPGVALQFTAILPGGADQNLFSVLSPAIGGSLFTSRAAEVAYFLSPTGATAVGPSGQPLFNLVRRQRLAAVTDDEKTSLAGAVGDTDVIASNGASILSLSDLTNPGNRLPLSPLLLGNARFGEDILLSNVLSFEVLVEWDENKAGYTGSQLGPRTFTFPLAPNSDAPNDSLAPPAAAYAGMGSNTTLAGQGVFDTWSTQVPNWNQPGPNSVPLAVRVKSLQITIRVFDPRTKLARQNTWKVSM